MSKLSQKLEKASRDGHDSRREHSFEADAVLGLELTQERMEVPVDLVRPSPYQPRIAFDDEYIENLAANIEDIGLNQPIVVRMTEDGLYELIAGENRLRAFRLLKREAIPAIIRHIDNPLAAKAALADNIHRRDLTDFEIGAALRFLMDEGMETSISGLSRLTGKDRTDVRRLLSYSDLPQDVITIIRETPSLIGGTIAKVLADYTLDGHDQLVIEAVGMISHGKLTQMRAPSWIASRLNQKEKIETRHTVVDRHGNKLGVLQRNGNEIKFRCAPEIPPDKLEDAILKAIHALESSGAKPTLESASDEIIQ